MKPYIIFDMDGTLIDSERWYFNKFKEFFAKQGYSVPEKALLDSMGLPTREILFRLKEYLNGRDLNELSKAVRHYIGEFGQPDYRTIVFPHVKETLERIHKNGIDMVVASSSPRSIIQRALTETGIADQIAFYMGREDVEKVKPDPEVYLKILEKKQKKPLAVVEDSEFGIRSAKGAGLSVVAFDSGFGARNQQESDYKIRDFFELPDILKQLPGWVIPSIQ